MSNPKIQWYKVAESVQAIDWQANGMAIAEAGGKKITLLHKDGVVNACAHKCPHAGGIMADGFIDVAGNIVCPLHRFRFNIENGRNTSGEGYYLSVYPLEHRADGIWVGIKQNSWMNFF